MMRGWWLLCVLGCSQEPRVGIAVGNPGDGPARLAPLEDFDITAASVDVAGWEGITCEGETWFQDVGATIDLVDGAVALPTESWCGLRLALDGPLEVQLAGLASVEADGRPGASTELSGAPAARKKRCGVRAR